MFDALYVQAILVTALVSAATFLGLAVPLTLLAMRDPTAWRKYRIQARPVVVGKHLLAALQHYATNSGTVLAALTLAWPLVRLGGIHSGPIPRAWVIAGQVVLFYCIDEVCFYAMHRALHTSWLYKRVHSVHHRVTSPFALQGNYMHLAEFAGIAFVVFVPPFVLGVHVVSLWIWVALRQCIAAEGHCGYEIPFNPMRLIPGHPGAKFHDWHHRRFIGNYGSSVAFFDRWFGTLAKGYPDER